MNRLHRLATAGVIAFAVSVGPEQASGQLSATSADQASDALATKLAECRSVTYEQNDALSECRKAWAEKRRQFLGQRAPSASSDNGTPQEGSSLFVPPKDESRLSPGYPPIPQSGKE